MKRFFVLTFLLLTNLSVITAQEIKTQEQANITPTQTTQNQDNSNPNSNNMSVNITLKDNEPNNTNAILARHLSQKLHSNSNKQLLGILLTSLSLCNAVGCCYDFHKSNGLMSFYYFILFWIIYSELSESLNLTFNGYGENILAIIQNYDKSGTLDPIIEKKVALLFTRLSQDLTNISPATISTDLLENLNKEIALINSLKEEDKVPAILNFFERHGNTLTQNGYEKELKNNNGEKLLVGVLLSSFAAWLPIVLRPIFTKIDKI